MARYKHIDSSPKFLPVDLTRQLLPGTFEHALNHLLDHEVDLSGFDARYCNDETGASAYAPAMLLKIVLFAYGDAQRLPSPAINKQAKRRWLSVRCKAWLGVIAHKRGGLNDSGQRREIGSSGRSSSGRSCRLER